MKFVSLISAFMEMAGRAITKTEMEEPLIQEEQPSALVATRTRQLRPAG